MKDFTFSDGTFIPEGAYIFAPVMAIHRDDEHYDNPHVFDPWRFSEIRCGDGEGMKHQMVSTSREYVAFGHGKHAWYVPFPLQSLCQNDESRYSPGRFFAAVNLKLMLSHTLLHYDVSLEREGEIPRRMWVAVSLVPNPTENVLFRRRRS